MRPSGRTCTGALSPAYKQPLDSVPRLFGLAAPTKYRQIVITQWLAAHCPCASQLYRYQCLLHSFTASLRQPAAQLLASSESSLRNRGPKQALVGLALPCQRRASRRSAGAHISEGVEAGVQKRFTELFWQARLRATKAEVEAEGGAVLLCLHKQAAGPATPLSHCAGWGAILPRRASCESASLSL